MKKSMLAILMVIVLVFTMALPAAGATGIRDRLRTLKEKIETTTTASPGPEGGSYDNGAPVYLDGGYAEASAVIDRLFPVDDQASAADAKSALQQVTQARWGILPEYALVGESGPDHAPVFSVEVLLKGKSLGRGTGKSKKSAEQAAAREALDKLTVSEEG